MITAIVSFVLGAVVSFVVSKFVLRVNPKANAAIDATVNKVAADISKLPNIGK